MKTWEALQLVVITLLTSLVTYLIFHGFTYVIYQLANLWDVNVEVLAPFAVVVMSLVGPILSSVIAITAANWRISSFSESTPISQRKRKLALILVGVGALFLTVLWTFLVGVLPNLHHILANPPGVNFRPPI